MFNLLGSEVSVSKGFLTARGKNVETPDAADAFRTRYIRGFDQLTLGARYWRLAYLAVPQVIQVLPLS